MEYISSKVEGTGFASSGEETHPSLIALGEKRLHRPYVGMMVGKEGRVLLRRL